MSKLTEELKKQGVDKLLKDSSESLVKLVNSMPYQPTTSDQRNLMGMHGSPKEFAKSCLRCFQHYEISFEEAKAAIEKYRAEWEAAV